ncbi:MAG: FAD:protein FMN transferase [Owenweeksia sp.]|nr:FAD:protein FMN transferase [Owenweeksia sp.]
MAQEPGKNADTTKVDSIMSYIGYQNIVFRDGQVKLPTGFQIDFNAIAQGYTVDLISEYLKGRGVDRFMVEVGGEVRARAPMEMVEFGALVLTSPLRSWIPKADYRPL